MADAFEEAYRGAQSESQMRRVLSDIHNEIHGRPLDAVTFDGFQAGWMLRVEGEYEPSTFDRIKSTIRAAKEACPELFEARIETIDRNQIIRLRNALAKDRAASTTNTMIRTISAIFRAAWQDGILGNNPAAAISRLKASEGADGESPERRAFTLPELKRLLRAADNDWRDLILADIYTCGQRLGDISRTQVNQVDLSSKSIKFRTRKTKRWVVMPIAQPLLVILKKRVKGKEPTDYVFPEIAGLIASNRGSVSNLSRAFARIMVKAGLRDAVDESTQDGRRKKYALGFHSLRHTATSMLKRAGVSGAVVMDLVGHDSDAVSEHYTNIDDATKRAAIDRLPKL